MSLRGTVLALVLAASPGLAWADAAAEARGHAVFDRWCGLCHAPGPLMAGNIALNEKYKGAKPVELERRTDLTPEIVKSYARRGANYMPRFRKTEISDAELDDVAAYLTRTDRR